MQKKNTLFIFSSRDELAALSSPANHFKGLYLTFPTLGMQNISHISTLIVLIMPEAVLGFSKQEIGI